MKYFSNNEIFFLSQAWPHAKQIMKATKILNAELWSAVMARNGVDFGIKVSGLGDRWFVGQARIENGRNVSTRLQT